MRSKLGIIIIAAIVIGTIGYALVMGGESPADLPTATSQPTPAPSPSPAPAGAQDDQPREIIATGRYTDFTSGRQMEEGFTTTILFFYASWCPECRGFDQAIVSQNVPDGTQILRVNYDDSQSLKQQYGVTIQSTFVSVTSNGELISKWVGYGQDKSVEAILQNVGN